MVEPLHFQVIRSKKRKKTISIHIKEDGKIAVYTPFYTSQNEIEQFVNERKSWLNRVLLENEKRPKREEKKFFSGEEFLYLGKAYPLEIAKAQHGMLPLRFHYGKFILDEDHLAKARDLFVQWYKHEAREKLTERVHYFSRRFQLAPSGLRITSARERWGSCSRDDRLSFSWRMMMASLEVIDYILIHELVHIREKNHSRRFWDYLSSLLPDYKSRRLWLKKYGNLLWI